MDTVDYRDHLRLSAGRMKWWREVDTWRGIKQPRREEEGDEELVEVLLRGKAPWGFTLRGGTEHREPLVITKVEEGSVAASVHLQAGDKMVSVNAVPLSGSRQEAICLVKSSHKTLTLVVQRKNDPGSRPHSWHSSKLTEEESEPARKEAAPAAVWQSKHEARPEDSAAQGDQDKQQQQPFSSVNHMEKLERPSNPYPPGRLSPNKYNTSAELGGAKRDSGLSCFSSGSSPPFPDPASFSRKGTSAENIFFKGFQSEGSQQAERPRYLQPTLGNGGWEGSRPEEQPASRVSVSGRPSFVPVWQVPEKKKSQSPPPPPPPLRSDSFAATKVFPYSEGLSAPTKAHGRSFEKLTENHAQSGALRFHQEKTSESRRSFNPLPTKDLLHPSKAADHNHNQLHPNKLFSLSSTDIRQFNYTSLPAHQRQYSDESPLYLQTRSAPPTKIQSVGSYYRSLQDLPTNAFSRRHVRHSTASSSAGNQNAENGGHKRNYSLTSKISAQRGKAEAEKLYWTSSKAKYSLPQSQTPYKDTKERTDHSHPGNSLQFDPQSSELSVQGRSLEDAAKTVEGHSNTLSRNVPVPQSNDPKVSLSLRHQDPWVPQEDHRISPLKTPLLHSLAQESRTLTESKTTTQGNVSDQETSDAMAISNGKTSRRSDRYATTLRNEIQQKRAQLQKSRSAATLTCDAEEEETEEWKSTETSTSSGVSFTNTYKDHLKEAQARVLQATSFQRRDLEPLGPEAPVVKVLNGRIRGRKRFHMAKRTHSFSEPDKIDKLGVEGEPQTGSFGETRKFLDVRPAFSRPVLKSGPAANLNADLEETGTLKEKVQPAPDPVPLSPGQTQVLIDQQRLGTFAEYQASWNKQKKPSESKTQGRYHSAENILDSDVGEKALCIHERSRSSPSADFYSQNNPSSWRDAQSQQSSYTTGGTTESRTRYQPDHNPQPAPPVPWNEGPVPGLTDHRTKPDTANPSHTTHPTGPCSLNPNPGSEPPQTKSLLPPPRLHLGPETTSSSQEFLTGAQADLTALQPLSTSSSDTQQHAAAQNSSTGPAQACSPQPIRTQRGGVDNKEEEKEEQQPSSISGSSSWTPLALPADGARSPSPQFAPLRLTDKPPAVFVQEDSPLRSDDDVKRRAEMDINSPVRKVPVRIIHTEGNTGQEGRAYLPQTTETCSVLDLLPHIPSLSITERPASSLFSAYSRQTAQDPAQAKVQESISELSCVGSGPSEEDAKREELARDIMGKDKSLVDILDQSGRMTTMDLMEGLFPTDEQILEGAHLRRRASAGSRLPTLSPRSMERREEEDLSVSATASLVPSSSYYNTSAPKAELLIKMKDMQEQLEDQDSEDELDVDLASKKQELISSLAGKLEVLREARHSLQEDVEDNETLGREVEATVQRLCQPNQLDKFRMFVGDLDKVVSLLLSLSGRLARVENALNSLEDEAPPEEKRTLTEKRKLLMRQHEDAKELKENLDRRERLVSSIMEDHLDAESLDDYRHFVKMKSALIIEQRKLEDKIKLGEEQLKCLVDSLPLEQRPPL
ncbi:protein Shroom2-like isoform X1 [Xyrichtys novacula]|uniref:Protein Shroom2-like isoform X1 n=1 Tax=Xyrichtys novacula TaxID=13765 RepID=A0AAV1HRH1_XYRNO|nr:protein Shroom2-like isoform X1 [Xyrichtys novacula]